MKRPIVFTDFHHAGLLHSLILLFEKRLGGLVYRPIGTEWFKEGYWKIYGHPATVEQYLGIGGATPDGSPPLNEVQSEKYGIYKCQDIDSGYFNRAITLEAFFNNKIDVVIASIPQHIKPFEKLCAKHPDKPKLVYQIGNSWTKDAGLADNIMASAMIDIPEELGYNIVTYHQEFPLEIFHKAENEPKRQIASFVNCFSEAPHLYADWFLFKQTEKLMKKLGETRPEFRYDFKAFGGQCRDGAKHGAAEVAQEMRDSMFIWHTKQGGDGYGHVIHNAPAVGRPLIVKREYYRGKFGDLLIKDGETAIVIDGLEPFQIADKVLYYSEPTRYKKMCEAAYKNFKQVVDFDREQKHIERFLAALK